MGSAADFMTKPAANAVPPLSPGGTASPDAGVSAADEDFWNVPNALTLGRVAVVPLMMAMPWMLSKQGSQLLAWLYIAAAITDIIDGWLARRGQIETKVGKLLDPLADKLLVATSLIMLLAVGRLEEWVAPMVVVIVGRELAVTGLRGIASADGTVMAAARLGKLKTLTQNVAIACLLFHYPTLGLPAHELGLAFLSLATLLTLWSGYAYFADYFGWHRRETV